MATIQCQDTTFENIEAVLFDKDGTLAAVESYLILLGQLRAQYVVDDWFSQLHHQVLQGQILQGQDPETISSQKAALKTRLLSAFGQSASQSDRSIDPAGLMAVGSREHNEVAAATCLVRDANIGWIATLESVKSSFRKAEQALPLKVANTPLLTGASQLLLTLRAAEVASAIVSSDVHSEVEAFVAHYGLETVSWYCGERRNQPSKTHPDFLKFACRSLGVSPNAVLVVGDAASDLLLASQGAEGFIAMTGGWSRPPVLEDAAFGSLGAALGCSKLRTATVSSLSEVEVFK